MASNIFNSVVKSLTSIKDKAKDTIEKYQAEQERLRQEDEARKANIASGSIQPITETLGFSLEKSEQAYVSFSAQRMATVEYVEEHMTGKSKKTGVIRRSIVGGLLTLPLAPLMPIGVLAGALTAGNKNNSMTKQIKKEKIETIDFGTLFFTNKRIVFLGKSPFSIPYNQILTISYGQWGQELHLQYPTMLPNEYFSLDSANAKEAQLYFEGITKHLLLEQSP